jgi:hypothetical protein
MTHIQWTIPELLARYELEPELRDVFVEGQFDRDVYVSHFVNDTDGRAFYQIDSVEVPASLVVSHGMSTGNKQRAVVLSRELQVLPKSAKVFCLVDRDLDHWFASISNSDRLRWSIYCSIEGHFVNTSAIRDVLLVTSRAAINDLGVFESSLFSVLVNMYALRAAAHELSLSLRWLGLRRYLSSRASEIRFNVERYTAALLNANSATGERERFSSASMRWRTRLSGDVRFACRGHDFTEIMAWAVSEFKGQREFSTVAAVERLFVLLARSTPTLAAEVN